MNLKLKGILIVLLFIGIFYIPFAASAWGGYLFEGIPAPFEFTNLEDAEQEQQIATESDHQAAIIDEYGACVAKPEMTLQPKQMPISYEEMQDHMHILEQGETVTQCAGCHTSREDFCDKCHAYAGVNPDFKFPDKQS